MPKKLPKISLITPTLNQENFIEQTIKSVLSQNYPNLEYFVIDGGSKDATVDILKKYSGKIRWFSEKDYGQSDALNKGLKFISGDIVGYLNSDDLLEVGCLEYISDFFNKNSKYSWVTAKCSIIDEKNNKIRKFITVYKNIYLKYLRFYKSLFVLNYISQPVTFWRREVLTKIGIFDESLHYAMDYDYWLRIFRKYKLGFIDEYLASFRIHPDSKGKLNLEKQLWESYTIASKNSSPRLLLALHRFHDLLTLLYYKNLYRVK